MPEPSQLPQVCVVYLVRDAAQVLLGRKLTGLGEGKVVAPGGKLEIGESPLDAAVREVLEEVGISVEPNSLELLGKLTYLFPTRPEWSQISSAFRARGSFGAPLPSAELEASWVPIENLPLEQMWDDAKYWLPDLLAGVPVTATFEFGKDLSTVQSSNYKSYLN